MVLGLVVMVGCNSSTSPNAVTNITVSNPVLQVSVVPVDNWTDQFLVILPDGKAVGREVIEASAKDLLNKDMTVEFFVTADNTREAEAFWVGNYWCDVRWEYHYVGSCIQRNLWHLQLHIKNGQQNYDIFNLHMCVWWENGPQFGAYNSANGWCANTRGTYTRIRDTVANALRSQGFSNSVAYSIAAATAVIVVIAFGLSWA